MHQKDSECRPDSGGGMCLRETGSVDPTQGAACVCQERGSPAAVLRKGLAASQDEQAVLWVAWRLAPHFL